MVHFILSVVRKALLNSLGSTLRVHPLIADDVPRMRLAGTIHAVC